MGRSDPAPLSVRRPGFDRSDAALPASPNATIRGRGAGIAGEEPRLSEHGDALRRHLRPLRRWWLLVSVTAVAALACWLATRDLPPRYRVRTTILVGRALDSPNPTNNDVWLTHQLARTYADLARRRPIQNAVREQLGLDRLPDYHVSVVADTQLVEVEVTDTDPERARQVAAALGDRLVALGPAGDDLDRPRQGFVERTLDALEGSMRRSEETIAALQEELASTNGAQRITSLEQRVADLQRGLNEMQSNYAALLAQTSRGSLNSLRIVEPPALPSEPIGPSRGLLVLFAAAIGLMLAVVAAYLLDLLDDSVRSPAEVKTVLGLTTLTSMPSLPADEDAQIPLDAAGLEALRMLRTNLRFASIDRELRTLVVTSAAPGEGKSRTTANLARVLAQSDQRVLIVDADLRRPRQHQFFRTVNNVGLTTALLEPERPLSALIRDTGIDGVRLLSSGPLPPNSSELLDSARMRALVERLGQEADVVLVDSPPVLATADASILSTLVDGTLLVVDAGGTRRGQARQAIEALGRVEARVLGVVLNRASVRRSDYYYYYAYRSANEAPRRWWRRRGGRRHGVRPVTAAVSPGLPSADGEGR